MARERNEIYLENGFDTFYVEELLVNKPYHEYTIEVYRLRQEVKIAPVVGYRTGYDFLFHGVRFYQYITDHPAILEDKKFIDRMFEMSFKDALSIG